jgi:phospholipid N-methyltransferase
MISDEKIAEYAERAEISVEEARRYFYECEVLNQSVSECVINAISHVRLPVLELGAGDGSFTKVLLEQHVRPNVKLYAIERSNEAAEKLKLNVQDERLSVVISDS